ncbi:GGDEF domain-containing protein [Caldalkalibacillus mannanilyticus]|uniref:GGDEF domain-containing protein n=1 Tax=Caldalkalibacillus mannanilyticus TaxID=1418 RepID=UPI0004680DD0|nr:GGDEF domain-containing protein [Caldalkalibacillus mannanilyticus]
MRIIERDKNPELLKSWDEASSKLREFSEKELTGKIDLLFELQNAQNKKIEYQRISLYLSTLVILLLIGAITWKIHENKKINQLKNQLYHQSITDGLTGVFNREKIFEILDKEVKKDSVIALVDIDNFKSINDTLGYLVGDDVLKRVVDTIKMSIREQDEIGRYGGEEFIIIIKDTTLEDAVKIIERIRKNVEALEWEYDQLKTTISAGVCKKSALAVEEVFKEVDELVHEAKRTGKNKVVYKICF